jgi:TatD family-associated radical SAM protein
MATAVRKISPLTSVYNHEGGLYINLTNRCPTICRFCIKRSWKWRFHGNDLKLKSHEPTAAAVWETIETYSASLSSFKELVFCGYGESTYQLPVMVAVGQKARKHFPTLDRRLNTIGLGNLIWGRSIVGDLRSCLDEVSVSLNTANPDQWLKFHSPYEPYREAGFAACLEFIHECVASGLRTTVTAINFPKVDIPAVRQLAKSLGAGFRLRLPL